MTPLQAVKQAYATCVAEAESEVHEAHAAVTRLHGEIAQSRRNARAAVKKAIGAESEINSKSSASSSLNNRSSRRLLNEEHESSTSHRHRSKAQSSSSELLPRRKTAEDSRGSSSDPRSSRSSHPRENNDKSNACNRSSNLKRSSSDKSISNGSSIESNATEGQMGAFPWDPLTGTVSRRAAPLMGTMEILMEELDLQKEMMRAQQRELAKEVHEDQSSLPKKRAPGGRCSMLPSVSEKALRSAFEPVQKSISMGSFY